MRVAELLVLVPLSCIANTANVILVGGASSGVDVCERVSDVESLRVGNLSLWGRSISLAQYDVATREWSDAYEPQLYIYGETGKDAAVYAMAPNATTARSRRPSSGGFHSLVRWFV